MKCASGLVSLNHEVEALNRPKQLRTDSNEKGFRQRLLEQIQFLRELLLFAKWCSALEQGVAQVSPCTREVDLAETRWATLVEPLLEPEQAPRAKKAPPQPKQALFDCT